MSVKIIKKQQALYAIEGELNMQTVPDVSKQMDRLMRELASETGNVTFDLTSISRADSAGVAFMVDAMQLAKSEKLTLLFSNLPQQMKDIAGISGLLDILPISEN
jgi:phospholipid transport system transporter-binding protein